MFIKKISYRTNKPGTAQLGASLKGQKSKKKLNMQKDTNAEISSILQCPKVYG